MIKIPFNPQLSGVQKFRIELEAQLVTIQLRWNPRSGYWHLTVIDEFGGRMDGIKVVRDWPLLRQSKGTLDFSGDLIVLPLDATAGELVGFDGLGTTFGLIYMTSTEVEAWEDAHGLG